MTTIPAPFWMVVGIGSGPPTVQHTTKEVAVAEARRLARQVPDTVFVVLEAVEAFVKRDIVMVNMRAGGNQIKHARDCQCIDCEIPF